MRLIRSIRRATNFGLSLPFQRRQDTKSLIARLHPVLNNKSNLVNGSNILGCDRSYSASAASKALEDKKPPHRVTKNERKSMVETYVNEYRLANEGKFPSASDTQKKVGGGYYVVKQILQEVIYKSKQSSTDSKYTSLEKSTTTNNETPYNSNKPIDIKDNCLEKSTMKEDEIPFKFEEVPQTRDLGEDARRIKEDEIPFKFEEVPQTRDLGEDARPILKDTENSSSMISQSKNDQQISVSVEAGEPKDVGAQSHHPIDKPDSSRDLDYEKEREILEEKVKSDALDHKAEPPESTEVSGRELEEVSPKYAESENKSSVWTNLKSFANEIWSIWKRS